MGKKIIINQTDNFKRWHSRLKELNAKQRISARLKRVSIGNFGDFKSVGGGVYEMRIDSGPGYRIYFAQQDKLVYLLLCGGTKASQEDDIEAAKQIWSNI
ncbi:MAG: type II toxin-antitoxin system RelE/ParE family toxin [Advenella sp.]